MKNDATDVKFEELKFMETLVKDNYLCYYWGDKVTTCYLVTPAEAFKESAQDQNETEGLSLTSVLNEIDFESVDPEKREELIKAKEMLLNQKIDFGLNIPELPEALKSLAEILPIGTGAMTVQELMDYSMKVLRSMEENKGVYKGLRNIIDQHII